MMNRQKLHNALIFAFCPLPISAVAAFFSILYQIDMFDAAMLAEVTAQMGSTTVLIAVYIFQIVIYVFVCGFVGYLLADRLGLMQPVRLEKRKLLRTVMVSVMGGVLFALDYWTFGLWIPGIQESTSATLEWKVIAVSVLYGGIVEEVMLRLFMMSLIAWILWKVFFRQRQTVPAGVIIAANVIAAILFAAGHLPATQMLFGTLTPLILVRCFLLNGGFGMLFGWLYRKYGIQYAMISHALLHIVSKLIWFIFV